MKPRKNLFDIFSKAGPISKAISYFNIRVIIYQDAFVPFPLCLTCLEKSQLLSMTIYSQTFQQVMWLEQTHINSHDHVEQSHFMFNCSPLQVIKIAQKLNCLVSSIYSSIQDDCFLPSSFLSLHFTSSHLLFSNPYIPTSFFLRANDLLLI